MSNKPRGMALIINNRNFTCGMKERVGTDKDAENLFHLFNWLGMATIRKDNLTGKEMIREIEVSRAEHTHTQSLSLPPESLREGPLCV